MHFLWGNVWSDWFVVLCLKHADQCLSAVYLHFNESQCQSQKWQPCRGPDQRVHTWVETRPSADTLVPTWLADVFVWSKMDIYILGWAFLADILLRKALNVIGKRSIKMNALTDFRISSGTLYYFSAWDPSPEQISARDKRVEYRHKNHPYAVHHTAYSRTTSDTNCFY